MPPEALKIIKENEKEYNNKNNKNNTKCETIIENFNQDYNIVKIYKKDFIDFYIEKKGYGNLYFIFGIELKEYFNPKRSQIYIHIGMAEQEKFWGE